MNKREYTDEELIARLRELISQFDEAEDGWNRSEWAKKYNDRLGPYVDKLKTLNGDDFDIFDASYSEYHDDYEDIGDDAYIDALEDNIKKVLHRVWPEASEEQIEETAEEICDEHKADEVEGGMTDKPVAEVEVKTTDTEAASDVAEAVNEAVEENTENTEKKEDEGAVVEEKAEEPAPETETPSEEVVEEEVVEDPAEAIIEEFRELVAAERDKYERKSEDEEEKEEERD